MKKTLTLITFSIALACSATAQTTRYELDLKEFSELKVTDGIAVDYICNPDSAGKAVFFAEPQTASQIIFKPDKQKLEIQLVPREERMNRTVPKVTVYSTFLVSVENSGDSLVRVLSVAPTAKFKARVIGNGRMSVRGIKANQVEGALDTGNGTLAISGTADNAKLSCTGTGHIQADALVAKEVNARVLGTGSIGCTPTVSLSTSGAGSGKVYYNGNPVIKKRGVGIKVEAMNPSNP